MLGKLITTVHWQVHRGTVFGLTAHTPPGRETRWVSFAEAPPPLRRSLVALGLVRVIADGQPCRIERVSIRDSSIKLHRTCATVRASSLIFILLAELPVVDVRHLFELSGKAKSDAELDRLMRKRLSTEKERRRQKIPG